MQETLQNQADKQAATYLQEYLQVQSSDF